MLDIDDIRDARSRIAPLIHQTPLFYSNSFSAISRAAAYLKAEHLQKTGSFKVRGALNKIRGISGGRVIAASMGNHAQGVAFGAARLGKSARIVMPFTSSIIKQEATRAYGAEVVLHGESFSEALEYARLQKEFTFIHAYDDYEVIAGQGTIALEIFDQLEDIDAVLVPVGGGGLIAGISACVKAISPRTEVIGVQTVSAPSACLSFREKRIVEAVPDSTIADGIAVGRVGEKTFGVIREMVDDMILVKEDAIAAAVLSFLERKKLVVEGAGAVSLAAVMENKERFSGKRMVVVVTGGNIDFTLIDRIIHKGLVSSSRIGVFDIIVDDQPGRLHSLTGVIAERKGNILNVVHDRLAPDLPVGKTRVVITAETRGESHLHEILASLNEKGFTVAGSRRP